MTLNFNTLQKNYRKDVMYVLNFEEKSICKMNNQALANFLNTLKVKDFEKFGFIHTEKLAKDFIKRNLDV